MKQLLYIAALLTLIACRKDVELNLPDYTQKIVVEASIETGMPATVYLSYSVPYFGEFNYSTPQKAFIKKALVVVTDGFTADTLKELEPLIGYFYQGSKLLGKEGRIYSIKISVDGRIYETSTAISYPARLDSLYFKPSVDNDSLGYMMQTFTEPAGGGDCYRWYAKRLGRDEFYAAPFNSVFDDKFIDGKTFEFGYNRGRQPDRLEGSAVDPEQGYFKRGDTVVVKFCKIGRREYDFWNTYYQNRSSNGNPFSAPANVKSMFEEHEQVFGAFVGYATYFDTLVIPKK
jgi:hypothetical protein